MGSYDLSVIESFFKPVLLMLPRIAAVFTIVPFLSSHVLSGLVRSSLILMLALFFSPMIIDQLPEYSTALWLLIVLKEALIGIMLGLSFSIFFWAIQTVGELIDFQTGAGNASFFDPISGHAGGPTGNFLVQLLTTLFITIGGMLIMLGILVDSYQIWPVTSFFPDIGKVLVHFVVHQGGTLLSWIVKLAAPVILVLLLAEIGLGLVNRFAPQLNVFIFSLPLKSYLATLMLLLFLMFIFDLLQGFLKPGNDALNFMRSVL